MTEPVAQVLVAICLFGIGLWMWADWQGRRR
jgi:hypothetical protein